MTENLKRNSRNEIPKQEKEKEMERDKVPEN